jgi:hypothetical protein
MSESLTDWLQRSRLTVVDVDPAAGRLRVRGEADACSDLSCPAQVVVMTEEGSSGLQALNPGDIVRLEPPAGRPEKIIVLRRVWEEIASPEL